VEKIMSIVLVILGPVLGMIAKYAPDKFLAFMLKIDPIVDEVQRQVSVENARRAAAASVVVKDQAAS
jgi:hypothetical protein